MNTLEILTLGLMLITGWYVWVTAQILKANNRALTAMKDQTVKFIQLEAYDKRLKVYNAITRFIANIKCDSTTDNEKLMEMLRETKYAKFLFAKDDEIEEYLALLYQKGNDLEYKEKAISGKIGEYTEEKKKKLVKEADEIRDWLKDQYGVVDTKFQKYFQL